MSRVDSLADIKPLFLATLNGKIRPALFGDRPMENVIQAFNDFYM